MFLALTFPLLFPHIPLIKSRTTTAIETLHTEPNFPLQIAAMMSPCLKIPFFVVPLKAGRVSMFQNFIMNDMASSKSVQSYNWFLGLGGGVAG